MTAIEHILPAEVVYALGWTLLHSVWQIAVVAGVLGISLQFLEESPAAFRYRLALLALPVVLVWSAFTFSVYFAGYQPGPGAGVSGFFSGKAALELPAESSGLQAQLAAGTRFLESQLGLLVAVWLLGALVFAGRFLGGLWYVQRLRSARNLRPVPAAWQLRLTELARQLQVSARVQLAQSAAVTVPMVVGHLRPLVLLPVGLLSGLSARQVEAVLAHELAHISRNDFLVNLLQSVVEVLFFYHPALWWLSGKVRQERENACDDVAVAVVGSAIEYARVLAELEENALRCAQLALAMSGHRYPLLQRIQRLLLPGAGKATGRERLASFLLVLLGFASVAFQQPQTKARLAAIVPAVQEQLAYSTEDLLSLVVPGQLMPQLPAPRQAAPASLVVKAPAAQTPKPKPARNLPEAPAPAPPVVPAPAVAACMPAPATLEALLRFEQAHPSIPVTLECTKVLAELPRWQELAKKETRQLIRQEVRIIRNGQPDEFASAVASAHPGKTTFICRTISPAETTPLCDKAGRLREQVNVCREVEVKALKQLRVCEGLAPEDRDRLQAEAEVRLFIATDRAAEADFTRIREFTFAQQHPEAFRSFPADVLKELRQQECLELDPEQSRVLLLQEGDRLDVNLADKQLLSKYHTVKLRQMPAELSGPLLLSK